MNTLISILSIPEVSNVLIGFVISAVGVIFGKIVKDSARRAFIEKLVEKGIPIAYSAVDEIARKTPNTVDDKIAAGLKILKDYVSTHGVDPAEVTKAQEDRAKILFDAMHAEDKKNGTEIVPASPPPAVKG